MIRRLLCIALALFAATSSRGQDADVTFFVIGKHANFLQDANGNLTPVDYSFFSEIFLTAAGDASNATLRLPTGATIPFRDMRLAAGSSRDNILLISGEDRYTTFDDLQSRYPDGDYRVQFDTPSGAVAGGTLTFRKRPLPRPPRIAVNQDNITDCTVLAPGRNARISWQPFSEGRADPNRILDDLVFVILTDENGYRVAHSGRPFEGRPYLRFVDSAFTIDGHVLDANKTYTLSVEHALLDDTVQFSGVPAFTTRAVTTKMQLRTGGNDMRTCRTIPRVPTISSSTTMLYYDDISDAAHFYGEVLGLEKTLDWDWIHFYRTGPASSVGVVTVGPGAWHQVQEKNSVMLSLVTEEVDAWYDRVSKFDDVVVLKELKSGGGIRSFLLEDPGGYTVEFFQWLERPE